MHSDQHFPQNGYIPNPPISTFFGQNVDFQPSKICPRNFIIFDRTDNRSQIMYHPSTASNFDYPGLNPPPYFQDSSLVQKDDLAPREVSSFMKEDSADIDFLLSFEDEEEEHEEDDEELSTARTQGQDASDTADSCYSKPKKSRISLSSSSSPLTSTQKSNDIKRKRDKMKKMVKSLRGIVPGGNQMNTVDVLDEAVKYLKSLKVEVQKIGVGNLKN